MNTNTLLIAATLTFSAMLTVPGPAQAATYQSYHCHCTAGPNNGDSCSCSYYFTLGKSQTKEFRGYCDDPLSEGVEVFERDGGTTCTIQSNGFGDYTTKSCTNWDPFSRDTVKIKVSCERKSGTATR